MSNPPSPEGLEVYEALYDLENQITALNRTAKRLHRKLDNLRKSLGKDLPTPKKMCDMGGPVVQGGPGGNKDD